MGLFDSTRVLAGIGLMIVGSLLLLPGIFPGTTQLFTYALVIGAGLLTYGTWLVGTSEGSPTV
ncbi:hypothetical protein [Halobellus limi]|jgi:hypothetical protein|uniref:Uncharacterized protein n=1 Tax=Halobellus limi TaxID=699433 RepID=A0A1H5VFD8_9EURY|nr:hypothetical protein [Halobellus limi]QCC46727.1 hypothetical protein DV707_03055 [Halobellus limi]SEF85934.1 hypothetical protein SAMN04488133_0945 [Halobellus limi]